MSIDILISIVLGVFLGLFAIQRKQIKNMEVKLFKTTVEIEMSIGRLSKQIAELKTRAGYSEEQI